MLYIITYFKKYEGETINKGDDKRLKRFREHNEKHKGENNKWSCRDKNSRIENDILEKEKNSWIRKL